MITKSLADVDTIVQRVVSRTGRRVRDLAVELASGGVVLRGRTTSFHVKQLAQQGAQEAAPDTRLENAIVVDRTSSF